MALWDLMRIVAIVGGASFGHAFSSANAATTWATWAGTVIAVIVGLVSLPVSNAIARRASGSERQLAIVYVVTFVATSSGVALVAIAVSRLLNWT
jgi:hypothetical protein